jgi:endonuclease/exonuclease/phosphatase family metal-dependent hydrolase
MLYKSNKKFTAKLRERQISMKEIDHIYSSLPINTKEMETVDQVSLELSDHTPVVVETRMKYRK